MTLHQGKLTARCETLVTEAMDAWIAKKAHEMGLRESAVVRELIYKGATGFGYSVHISKDMSDSLAVQPANHAGMPHGLTVIKPEVSVSVTAGAAE